MSEIICLLGEEVVFAGGFLGFTCRVYMLGVFRCMLVTPGKQVTIRGCIQQVFSNVIIQQKLEQ